MGNELSKLCLEADIAEIETSPESSRWTLKLGDQLEVLALMSPYTAPSERFQARLLWTEYPGSPPSLKFRDPNTGDLSNSRTWPQCPGYRPASLDACVHWTAEGQALHPEWRSAPATRWNADGNALFRVLCFLQDALDFTYSGRFQG